MADENIYGIRYEVDIESLKKSTKEATQQIKLANAKFDEASSSLEDWGSSTEGVSAKLDQLNDVLDAQKVKLNHSKNDYNDYSKKLANVTAELEKMRRKRVEAIEIYGEEAQEVKDVEKEIASLNKTYYSTKNRVESLSVSILKQQANINKTEKEIDGYNETLEDLKNGSQDAEDATEELGDGFTVLKGTLASLIADGISNFISGIGNAIEETKEFRKEMALLKEVADENEVAFGKAKEAYKNLLATSGDEGASTEALNNLLTAGFDEKNLDQIVAGVEGLAIRFKDTLKQEGIADSIQEWIGSGGESLTGNFAEALERMGYNLEDVTAKTKGMTAEQRQQWVINTLNKEGLNELSASYRENNKDAIEASNAQFELTNAISNFAAVAEPVVTAVKGGFAELLNTLFGMSSIDLSPLTNGIKTAFDMINGLLSGELSFADVFESLYQSIIGFGSKMIDAGIQLISNLGSGLQSSVPDLISKGLEMLEGFVDMLSKNMPKILKSGIEFIRNLVKGLMNALPELIAKVPEIISKFANIINDNAPTIIKAGFGIILDIIKGIINAIPTLIANIPKIITAIVDVWEAFNWINLGKKAMTLLKDGITAMIAGIKGAATNVNTNVVNALKNLPTTLKNLGASMMTNLSGAISNAIGAVRSAITTIFNAVVNGIKGLPDKMLSIGKDLVKGLWNGISNMSGWVIGKIEGFTSGVLDGIKNFFGVHSPSRETAWIGEMLGEGLGDGLSDSIKLVTSKAKKLSNAVLDELQNDLGAVDMNPNLIGTFKSNADSLRATYAKGAVAAHNGSSNSQVVNFYQTINSPKALDRLSVYRDTNSLMFSAKARLKYV